MKSIFSVFSMFALVLCMVFCSWTIPPETPSTPSKEQVAANYSVETVKQSCNQSCNQSADLCTFQSAVQSQMSFDATPLFSERPSCIQDKESRASHYSFEPRFFDFYNLFYLDITTPFYHYSSCYGLWNTCGKSDRK